MKYYKEIKTHLQGHPEEILGKFEQISWKWLYSRTSTENKIVGHEKILSFESSLDVVFDQLSCRYFNTLITRSSLFSKCLSKRIGRS